MRFLRGSFFVVVCGACVLPFLAYPAGAFADVAADQRAALQAQLSQLESEIEQNKAQLATQQQRRASLERDVAIYNLKIKVAQLGIKERDLTIQQLQAGITDKSSAIGVLDQKTAAGEESLAQILRRTREIDDQSFIQIMLGGSLTDLFSDIDNFETLQKSLGEAFTQIATTRLDLAARKQALEDQQQEEQDLRQIQVLEQTKLKTTQKEKQNLVIAARGQESIYQQVIASKERSAAEIRATLFNLRDTKAVSFGDMYAYAKEASIKTGVRPAVILGILSEESNLGQNIGTGNWRVDMKAPRDTAPFQQITAALGLNPDTQPVSKRQSYGYGGAMGPAQFIPSTWVLYQSRIAEASGQNPPNPWDPRTATFAAALLMADNGADAQTPAAERKAALKYLAGGNWAKSAYAFYGDDVMDLAAKFQSQINILGG